MAIHIVRWVRQREAVAAVTVHDIDLDDVDALQRNPPDDLPGPDTLILFLGGASDHGGFPVD